MYQRLNQAGYSHDKVVLMGMGLNMLLFVFLYVAGETHYFWVLLATLLLQWSAMKFVDYKKAFE